MQKLIDEAILVDFPLPLELQNLLKRIHVYTDKYESEDDMNWAVDVPAYDSLLDELDIVSKQYLSAGKISASQRDKLLRKYNIWW